MNICNLVQHHPKQFILHSNSWHIPGNRSLDRENEEKCMLLSADRVVSDRNIEGK